MFNQNMKQCFYEEKQICTLKDMQPSIGEKIAKMTKDELTFTYLSEAEKSTRKIKGKLEVLQKIGILKDSDWETNPAALLVEKTGRRYVEVKNNGLQYFLAFDEWSTEINQQEPTSVTLYSGMCLFGQSALSMYTADARDVEILNPNRQSQGSIAGWRVDNKLSLFELEVIERLTTILKRVQIDCKNSGIAVTQVLLDLPKVAYYMYVFEEIEQGNMTVEQALAWMDVVQKRVKKVCAYFQAKLGSEIVLATTTTLDQVGEYLFSELTAERIPTKEDVLTLLQNNNEFASAYCTWNPPATWKDIGYMGYILSMVASAKKTPTSDTMVLVDNPTEWPLFDKSKTFANILTENNGGTFSAKALYPYQQVFMQKDAQELLESNFYFTTKQPGVAELRLLFQKKFGLIA